MPVVEPEGSLSEDEEGQLYAYYGLPYPREPGMGIVGYDDVWPDLALWR